MTPFSTITFTLPTANTDGSEIPAGTAMSATVFLDTVNPPVKSFAVPAANIAAAIAGVVTVTFAQLGVTPVDDTEYFVDATVTVNGVSSPASNVGQFEDIATPSAPTGLTVS
jgi:hypothetical protein